MSCGIIIIIIIIIICKHEYKKTKGTKMQHLKYNDPYNSKANSHSYGSMI